MTFLLNQKKNNNVQSRSNTSTNVQNILKNANYSTANSTVQRATEKSVTSKPIIYKWTQRDIMGEFTKHFYEHQAQTEIRCIRMTKNPQMREQALKETLHKWKEQGFVEKPYSGCEGFRRTCKNPPAPGFAYCESCLRDMKAHMMAGVGNCGDCPVGGCAKPLTFPCAAEKK